MRLAIILPDSSAVQPSQLIAACERRVPVRRCWPCRRLLSLIRQRRIRGRVKYVYDPAKDTANLAKHGVSLALAEVLFAGPHVSMTDDRFEYGEVREVAFGFINDRLFVCVYADRDAERRVISLRKANMREVKRYGENLE